MEPDKDCRGVAADEPRARRKTLIDWVCIAIVLLTVLGPVLLGPVFWVITICSFDFYVYFGTPLIAFATLSAALFSLASRSHRRRWLVRPLKAAILAHGGVVCLALAMGVLGGGFVTTHMAGFWLKMKYHADVNSIRQWAVNYKPDPNAGSVREDEVGVGRADWPTCIAHLSPQSVFYSIETKTVTLAYGGGLGHWAFTVSPSDTWVWESE